MPELEIQFRALQAKDDRTAFYCGNIELDRFIQRYAGQNQFRHHIGITYILSIKTIEQATEAGIYREGDAL